MSGDLPTVAGAISTMIFVISTLPMLFKAFRTKDLRSYSLGNIATANVGNLVQCVYVLSLPVGSDLVPARVLPGGDVSDAVVDHPVPGDLGAVLPQ